MRAFLFFISKAPTVRALLTRHGSPSTIVDNVRIVNYG